MRSCQPPSSRTPKGRLSLANMDYIEFETSVGADGVFRGF
ncbi:DUF6924 domain-containing protein [Micromonospora maritima]|uniref:DUF6924 domain-containing protein n=1 Tax=Micromonospora maritima TaxID=986711 RepID=A0ABW7ZJK8_9ACTN